MTFTDDRRPRVVVADDHDVVRDSLSSLLRSRCDVVACVASGHEAVQAVDRLKPDLLVVDLMMPDLNGLEVCRRVKSTAPGTDVVIITAFDDSHVQAVALESGASAYLPKHSVAGTLVGTVHRIFAERQRGRR
jgi:CheY-like chemotaxis protein